MDTLSYLGSANFQNRRPWMLWLYCRPLGQLSNCWAWRHWERFPLRPAPGVLAEAPAVPGPRAWTVRVPRTSESLPVVLPFTWVPPCCSVCLERPSRNEAALPKAALNAVHSQKHRPYRLAFPKKAGGFFQPLNPLVLSFFFLLGQEGSEEMAGGQWKRRTRIFD